MSARLVRRSWTWKDNARFLAMFDDGYGVEDIALEFGVARTTAVARLATLRAQRQAILGEGRSSRAGPAQLLERDKRKAASYQRDFTAEFFGDPPPGFSALDRKRRGLPA